MAEEVNIFLSSILYLFSNAYGLTIKRVKVDESGMTLVDFRKVAYEDEPFIMVYQASKVFYVADPVSENWHVVLHDKKETNNEHEQANKIYEVESFTLIMIK